MKKRIAFAVIMGIITTCIISFMIIAINLGFVDGFFRIWLKSWLIAYLAVIPAILILGPVVQRIVDRIFSANKDQGTY